MEFSDTAYRTGPQSPEKESSIRSAADKILAEKMR